MFLVSRSSFFKFGILKFYANTSKGKNEEQRTSNKKPATLLKTLNYKKLQS